MSMACEHTSKYSRDIEPRGFHQDVSPTGAKHSTALQKIRIILGVSRVSYQVHVALLIQCLCFKNHI